MSIEKDSRIEALTISHSAEFSGGIEIGKKMVEALRSLAADNGTTPPTIGQATHEATEAAMNDLLYSDGKEIEPPPSELSLEAARYGAEIGVRELFIGRRY